MRETRDSVDGRGVLSETGGEHEAGAAPACLGVRSATVRQLLFSVFQTPGGGTSHTFACPQYFVLQRSFNKTQISDEGTE